MSPAEVEAAVINDHLYGASWATFTTTFAGGLTLGVSTIYPAGQKVLIYVLLSLAGLILVGGRFALVHVISAEKRSLRARVSGARLPVGSGMATVAMTVCIYCVHS